MDKTMETASNLATQLFSGVENVVNKYGQTVVDTVLWVTRMDALSTLFEGVVGLILLITSVLVMKWLLTNAKRWFDEDDGDPTITTVSCVIGVILSVVSILVNTVVVFSHLFSMWTYVAVFKPELYLAKKAIDATLSVKK